jgi:NAD(P)-dependent dehydrogenase (short-subunit alcohol dehydrogenase family)
VSKVVIITGATSGIGKAAALSLALGDADLVLVGRNTRRGADVVERIRQRAPNVRARFIQADLSAQGDVRRLARLINQDFDHLDVLINNAGARFDTYGATEDGLERTFATNHLGHFLLTCLLFDRLDSAPSARVVTVSSQAHLMAEADGSWLYQEQEYDRRQAYAKSKLANILFAFELARRLEGTRIASNAVDPGVAATNFALNNGLVAWAKHTVSHWVKGALISPAAAADTIVYLATSSQPDAVSGSLFRERRVVEPSQQARNRSLASNLWAQSARLTGADIRVETASERAT